MTCLVKNVSKDRWWLNMSLYLPLTWTNGVRVNCPYTSSESPPLHSLSEYSFQQSLGPSSVGDNEQVHSFWLTLGLYFLGDVSCKDNRCQIIKYLLRSIGRIASIVWDNPVSVSWVISCKSFWVQDVWICGISEVICWATMDSGLILISTGCIPIQTSGPVGEVLTA